MEVNYYKILLVWDFGSAPKLSTSKVDVLLVTQIPNIFNLLLSYIPIIAYIYYLVKWFLHFFFNLLFVCIGRYEICLWIDFNFKARDCCCCTCVHHKIISFLYSLHTLLLFLLLSLLFIILITKSNLYISALPIYEYFVNCIVQICILLFCSLVSGYVYSSFAINYIYKVYFTSVNLVPPTANDIINIMVI